MIIFANEPRPDVAAGLVKSIMAGAARLIGHIIFPAFTVKEKAGKFTAAKRNTGTATKNRTPGNALTGTHNALKTVEYSCDKYEDRAYVETGDIIEYGSEQAALNSTALVAGFSVAKKTEGAAADLIINATSYAAALEININAPFAAMTTATIAVKRYGTPVLVCSEYWLNELVASPIVAQSLIKLYGDKIVQDVITGVPEAMKALGSSLGVGDVLVGDNEFWKIESYEDAAAIVAIRPEVTNSDMDIKAVLKALPSFGGQPTFIPYADASLDKPFEVDTGYDVSTKANVVDVTVHSKPLVINAAGMQVIKLPAKGLVTVTTPLSSVPTGTYDADQTVELSCATSGARIYYTTNGTTPTAASTLYSSGISVTSTTTLKAIAIKDGLNDSDVLTVVLTINK